MTDPVWGGTGTPMSTTVLIMVTHASSLGLPEKYTPFTCGSFVCGDFPALLWQPVLAPHALTPLLLPFAPCAARHLSPPPPLSGRTQIRRARNG